MIGALNKTWNCFNSWNSKEKNGQRSQNYLEIDLSIQSKIGSIKWYQNT